MSKFKIYISATVESTREVEADSYEEAVNKALDNVPYAPGFSDYEFGDEWEASEEHVVDGVYKEKPDE